MILVPEGVSRAGPMYAFQDFCSLFRVSQQRSCLSTAVRVVVEGVFWPLGADHLSAWLDGSCNNVEAYKPQDGLKTMRWLVRFTTMFLVFKFVTGNIIEAVLHASQDPDGTRYHVAMLWHMASRQFRTKQVSSE